MAVNAEIKSEYPGPKATIVTSFYEKAPAGGYQKRYVYDGPVEGAVGARSVEGTNYWTFVQEHQTVHAKNGEGSGRAERTVAPVFPLNREKVTLASVGLAPAPESPTVPPMARVIPIRR